MYSGHRSVHTYPITAFGLLLQLQPNSIFLSHHSSSILQLQPAQQYFSLTPLQLQPPALACRTQWIKLGLKKEVCSFQGHRKKCYLLEGLTRNFLIKKWSNQCLSLNCFVITRLPNFIVNDQHSYGRVLRPLYIVWHRNVEGCSLERIHALQFH